MSGPVGVCAGLAMLLLPAIASAGDGAGAVERWPLIAVASALLCGGILVGRLFREWADLSTGSKVARAVGVAVASVGGFLILYGLTEAPPAGESGDGLAWHTDWERARTTAQSRGRPMMVDFRADWCTACDELEEEVFLHPKVRERLASSFVLVKIDFEARSPQVARLVERFKVVGLPRVAFTTPDGDFLEGPSFQGKLSVEAFQKRLDAVESGVASSGGMEESLAGRGWFGMLVMVFFAGVLASLTPCVYPLIPITVGVFGAREADSKGQALALSLTYVVGIGITYTGLGLAAASFGTVFGGLLQSPWVLGTIAVLFAALGLTSLGVFELQLPAGLQTRLSQTGGAGYLGALTMGLVAGVIAAPCVGPVVAGILVYVAQQGSVVWGGVLLFDFAMGLGLLFVVLGTFSGLITKLPSSGAWMDGVKAIFGIIFFAVALYYTHLIVEPLATFADLVWEGAAGTFGG